MEEHEAMKAHGADALEIKEADAVAALLWDYLRKDSEHKNRRQTGVGTKTKLGLLRTIKHTIATASSKGVK
jgi:hypothetical protein